MKFSIRTRLTLLITFVFLCIFFFLLIAGAIALYLGLNEEIDKELKIEEKRVVELFESEFVDLVTVTGNKRKLFRDELLEELDEIYRYKNQFAIFSLETNNNRRMYAGGLKNAQLMLPKGFLSKKEGYYNQRLDGEFYRVLISKQDWGTLVLGAENQTFLEVADEFREILLIGIPLTLILVFIGGRFLASLAMRPIVSVAEATEKITLTNLKHRLPEYTGKDEFGILVATLNKMITRLDDEVKRVQQFTQDAAHELRTPLTILRGELELLYQQYDISDDIRSTLQRTLDRTISLNKIIDDLMLLAQSDSGRYPLNKKIFQLDQVLNEIVEDVKILAENRTVEVKLIHCDQAEFLGDEQLIRRLILNISDNALKYTQKGRIDFSLKSQKDVIEIIVSDTGIGIPEEDLPYIFNRFYRVEKTRASSNKSSGLGLSICKCIVAAHEGEIHIDSAISEGTTITISLPFKKL
jgi:heavy metal sensor kinase